MPQAIIAFLESSNWEDAVRKAISIGGDSDTIACIAGGIAQAYYHGIPGHVESQVYRRLDDRLIRVVNAFREKYETA